MKTYTIHLLRHGMTDGNENGQYVGSMDVDLSTNGILQLSQLREKYDYGNPQLCFTSPMLRCKQTMRILFDDVQLIEALGLAERNLGDFQGKTPDELINDPLYMDWIKKGTPPPNGETNEGFAERVCTQFVSVVTDILKSGKTEAVVCAHGGVIMTILSAYGLPQRNMIEWMASNGRGFTIRVTPSVWMRSGMVEVIAEYPKGSLDEPDLSNNPVKKVSGGWGSDEDDAYSEDIFWADYEDEDEE